MHSLRERAAQIQNPGKTVGFGGTASYPAETQQNQQSCLAKEQRRWWISYLSFLPCKNVIFFQSHGCVLGRTKDLLNASSSAGRNLADNGVAHFYVTWHPHMVSPVAQTPVSVRVHKSLETIPSPNPQPWHQVLWPSATGITGSNPR